MNYPKINYKLLSQYQHNFEQLGFKYIDVPWCVPTDIQAETFLITEEMFNVEKPVGSAEQSFLYLHSLGELPTGEFQAITPCHRIEPVYDNLHYPYFMKLELYINDPVLISDEYVETLVDIIIHEYSMTISMDNKIEKIKTVDGFDININDIEVGSYGKRYSKKLGASWVYGTGLALPRFEVACEQR